MKYRIHTFLTTLGMAAITSFATADPTVYVPLGSGNQVFSVDAASDRITSSFTSVNNPHGLVATPDGEYLVAGSLNVLGEIILPAGEGHRMAIVNKQEIICTR